MGDLIKQPTALLFYYRLKFPIAKFSFNTQFHSFIRFFPGLRVVLGTSRQPLNRFTSSTH